MDSPLSRRTVLKSAGVLGLASALTAIMGQSPALAADPAPSDFATLRSGWVDQLTGRKLIVAGDADFTAAIATLDTSVAASQKLLLTGPGRTSVFSDASFKNDAMVVTTYTRLAQMATAWATPGSTSFNSDAVLAQVLDGLADTNRLIYNASQPEFGNWWSWEIGASKALVDAMCIVHDHLTATQIAAYCAAVDHFVPDPWFQFPPSRRIASTGANRVDLCQAVTIRAIVGDDGGRLQHAVAGLTGVWQYVPASDGFYRDGSFIQHGVIAYTGTYGVVLLGGLAKLFALLAPSPENITEPSRTNLFDSVQRTFAPVIYDAQMMDSVRGRAVSRAAETSHADAYTAIEAILRLAGAVDPTTAATWRSLCAGWISRDSFGSILTGASVPRTALVKNLLNSGTAAAAEPAGHTLFPAMDRSIHRGKGFAYALSMSSKRISWYECGNGENNKGAQQGSGMTYLYDHDNGHWDDAYWATVNLSRLPGITVDTVPLPDKVEGEWSAHTPAGDWTGGAVLDRHASVGQHLIGPGKTGLSARKSWFFDDDVIIALGADIHSSSGRPVETVIENRNLHADGAAGIQAGGPEAGGREIAGALGAQETAQGGGWLHLDDVAGYLLLDQNDATVLREERTGRWSTNNTGGPAAPISRRYATFWFNHGPAPAGAAYAYAVLPGATQEQTRARWRSPGFSVLRNDATAQGIRFADGVVAANFWAPGSVDDLQSLGPATVLWQFRAGSLTLAVADPTQAAASVSFILPKGGWHHADGGSLTRGDGGAYTLTVATAGSAGATHLVTVHH